MKVLLVFAGISESGFNKTENRLKLVWINHGLASLASSAKKAGHSLELVDLRQLSSWDEFRKELVRISPEVIGLTMMSVDFYPASKVASIIKEIRRDIKVVIGGPHPTLALEEVIDDENIDYIIQGEGEASFINLLKDLERGSGPGKVIKGIVPDLNSLPFINRDIFNAGEMPIDHFLRIPFVTIIAGRGCKYNCSFCQPAERMLFGSKVRRRSVDNIIKELRLLREKMDFQSLMFHDDCLTEDISWVSEFCDKYRRDKFYRPFVCQSRADIICKNENMIKDMARSGLVMMLIGFESGNQRILNLLRKGTRVEHNYKANEICKRHGIRVWANYMLGIPTETREEALDTLKMIKRIKPYRASPAFYTPHPGSDLYRYCKDNDLSLIKDHKDYSRFPYSPKIKGVDYVFLKEVLEESTKVPLSVKIRRKIDHIWMRKLKKHIRKFFKIFGAS